MSDLAPPTHVVPIPEGQCTANITPKWFVDKSEYHPHEATYRPLVNGKDAFEEVYRAIDAATKTVCIICWGFQPSMYFIRDATHPPIGELLRRKARDGIVVRVLCWACDIVGDVPVTGIFVDESNTPGRWKPGFYKDRPKSSTDEQYAYNVAWFAAFDRQWKNMARNPVKSIVQTAIYPEQAIKAIVQKARTWTNGDYLAEYKNLLFYSRSYSGADSKNLRELNYLDSGLSLTTKLTLAYTPTHHQKMVVVDHEEPHLAVGFVMGHNMLDGYWDTPDHSGTPQPPDCGRNGGSPLHDYSSRVTGPIVGDLFCNFADAWQKETNERLPRPNFNKFPLRGNDARAVCQILRTQPQYAPPRMDIAKCYLQAVSNATQYIAIENQYFRWPTLAAKITEAAAKMTACGRIPEEHGFLYLFVITNTSDAGMGSGTINTYRMLDALGRADRLPEVARHQRLEDIDKEIEAVDQEMKPLVREMKKLDELAGQLQGLPVPGLNERYAPIVEKLGPLEARKRQLEERKARLKPPKGGKQAAEAIAPRAVPGLKVHIATLVAPDTADKQPWQEVYIHAKLMMIDDAFMTAGSANINTRSMQTDSELNIAHHRPEITGPLREQQWDKYTRGKNDKGENIERVPLGTPVKEAFKTWEALMSKNAIAKKEGKRPLAQLAEFMRTSDKISDKD